MIWNEDFDKKIRLFGFLEVEEKKKWSCVVVYFGFVQK